MRIELKRENIDMEDGFGYIRVEYHNGMHKWLYHNGDSVINIPKNYDEYDKDSDPKLLEKKYQKIFQRIKL